MAKSTGNLEAALGYIRRGLAVLPLHMVQYGGVCSCGKKNCGSPGKHPLTENGVHDASKDAAQVRAWWDRWPNANIGIATGAASGIFVIDVDGEAGEESVAMLEADYGELPRTWEQLTGGGGRHIVFKRPALEKVGNRVRLAPGLDVRGDGGYIVAEPSNHVSGRHYYWEADHHPDDIPLADMPAAWVELLTADTGERKAPVELPDTFPEGSRNDLLFRLGASLRARGLSDAALSAALREENFARCVPPLADREVDAIVRSCCKYAPGDVAAMHAARGMAAAAPVEDQGAELDALRKLLEKEPYYSDAVIAQMVRLDDSKSPAYYDAVALLRAQDGYRDTDYKGAVKKYRARQKGLTVLPPGTKAALPPLEKELPDIPVNGLVLPQDWRLSRSGAVYKQEERPSGEPYIVTACPHPVVLSERMTNLDAGTEKLRIAFRRDGAWKTVVTDAATASSRNIVQLSNLGLQVTSESCKSLIVYLSEFATANAERLPRRESLARLGWVGTKRFAPYDDAIAYDGELDYQFVYNAVLEHGDPAAWLALMRKLRQSTVLRAILAASFASPLVALMGYQPFLVHTWGGSGTGKTVAQQAALSVWGDPTQLLKTLNTTLVGLERHASFFHSLPVALDELQSLVQKKVTMEQIVYALGLGKSKGRGTAGGGVEQEREWRNIFITSGEEPIGQENTPAGARNRVIELYLDSGEYQRAGIEAGDVAIRLMDTYGHAGRRYIDALIAETKGQRAPVLEAWTRMRDTIRDTEHTGKHINSVAILALGDYYASRFIFGAADEGVAFGEAAVLALEVLDKLDRVADIDPINRAWDFFGDWVDANRSRFEPDYDGSLPRLGWLQYLTPQGDMLYVIPQQLADALRAAGYSPRKTMQGFAERGYLFTRMEQGRVRSASRVRIGSDSPRVYAFPWPLGREFVPHNFLAGEQLGNGEGTDF